MIKAVSVPRQSRGCMRGYWPDNHLIKKLLFWLLKLSVHFLEILLNVSLMCDWTVSVQRQSSICFKIGWPVYHLIYQFIY